MFSISKSVRIASRLNIRIYKQKAVPFGNSLFDSEVVSVLLVLLILVVVLLILVVLLIVLLVVLLILVVVFHGKNLSL